MTLFNDSEVFQKERPTKPTDAQLDKFYYDSAKEIVNQGYSDSDLEDIVEDLKDLKPFNDSGFEMGKKLDRRSHASYDLSTMFLEHLEGLEWDYRQVNENNVKTWVKAHNIQPQFPKGTKLIVKESLHWKSKTGEELYITGGNPELAVYYVNANPNENGGTVLPYELVEARCSIQE